MSDLESDRDMCRKAAAEFILFVHETTTPEKKEILLIRAQEWIKLAYARNDTAFEQHLAELNQQQFGFRGGVQTQPMQQQQAKIEPKKDEK